MTLALNERQSLSKKVRFDIFKRDSFTCQYCGSHPPKVLLEVDHIIPVSKGGDNSKDNLATSCFDCNRGKGSDSLLSIPQSITDKHELIKEKELQYAAYRKTLSSIRNRIKKEVSELDKEFEAYFPEYTFSPSMTASIVQFLNKLSYEDVSEAMRVAISKIYHQDRFFKYFCGICWNKIKEVKNG